MIFINIQFLNKYVGRTFIIKMISIFIRFLILTGAITTEWPVPTSDLPPQLSRIDDRQSLSCPPETSRSLFWNWTRSGEEAVQPCPGGAAGVAR